MATFPLSDGFYADPAFLGLSGDAVALWTRSVSWSTHHLTDGFVPTSALAVLQVHDEQTPAELVARGIWKRTRGGFRFVVWPRQASSDYVEAKRDADRARQQRRRTSTPPPSRRDTRVTPPRVAAESQVGHTPLIFSSKRQEIQDKEHQQTPSSSVGARKRACRIPADFTVTEDMIGWARQHTPLVGRTDTDQFVDYWTAASGTRASKMDWPAAWRTWMRKAQRDAERDAQAQPRRPRPAAAGGGPVSATDANIAAFLGGGTTTGPLALTEGKP
jgi:hypothetical protein